jgi:hypothetical protein
MIIEKRLPITGLSSGGEEPFSSMLCDDFVAVEDTACNST